MIRTIIYLALIGLFTYSPLHTNAQEEYIKKEVLPIQILIKQKSDRALIRWAFDDPNAWYMNKEISFDIYRANLADGVNKKYIPIANGIKVAAKETLEEIFAKDDTNIGPAAILQAHYGAWESQGENRAQFGILDKKDELETKYMTLLYACDIDWNTAVLAGLGFEDDTTIKGEEYIYRLVPSDKNLAAKHMIAELADDTPIVISDWAENENQIVMGWNRRVNDSRFSGYFIEKSIDGRSFTAINDIPYVHLLTEDINDVSNILWADSVVNYEPHYYRVIGLDAFGERSNPSKAIKLQGRDRTPPIAPEATVALDEEQRYVGINWNMELQDDVNDIVIQKGRNPEGVFYNVGQVAKIVNEYKDEEVELVHKTYYKVCAVDTAQNYACTEPLYMTISDKIAPAAPQNLSGKIDSNGVVVLTWDMGTEPDLMGYYVQVSNGTRRVFTSMTPKALRMNMWTDTIPLDVLTEDIYYRVNAVDLRANTSDFSEIVKLIKPDIVPPNASVFKGYEVNDTSVTIRFVQSSSKDVELIKLQRKSGGNSFQDLANIENNQTEYIDQKVSSKTQYTYRLITTDDAGNSTLSPAELTVTTKNWKANNSITLDQTNTKESTELSWNLNPNAIKYVKLYKGSKKKMQTLKIFKPEEMKYSVPPIGKGIYRIRAFYNDGSKSNYSNHIAIN